MKFYARYLVVFLSPLSLACGGSGLGQPVSEFPSQAALEEFADETVDPPPQEDGLSVDSWQLQAGLSQPDEVNTQAIEILSNETRGNPTKVSLALNCAAREAARFYAEHRKFPDDGLRTFLALRCGSTVTRTSIAGVSVEPPDDTADSEVLLPLAADAGEQTKQLLDDEPSSIGFGYARHDGLSALVTIAGFSGAKLKRFDPIVHDDQVTISGRFTAQVEALVGVVNAGSVGGALCDLDRSVRLPHFRVTCPVHTDDESARLAILTKPVGRVLWTPAVEAIVRRADDAGRCYEPRSIGAVTEVRSDKEFVAALLAALNTVRADAGLSKVTIEAAQSKTNRRVLGHYFAEAIRGNTQNVETIALGVMAGWDVGGAIKGAGIISKLSLGRRNPARFLGEQLEDPAARWILMEPEIRSAAIGGRVLEPSGLAVLLSTYDFFGSLDHTADADAVFRQLEEVRLQNGLPRPVRLKTPEIEQALAAVANNKATTSSALEKAVDAVGQRETRRTTGYMMETNVLDYLEFAPGLLSKFPLEVGVGVTHYTPPGGAWAQYAILFVTVSGKDRSQKTATVVPLGGNVSKRF